MQTMARLAVLMCAGCTGLMEGLSEPEADSLPWEERVVELTNGELAALGSARFTHALNQKSRSGAVVEHQVRLLDGEGATSVDVLFSERSVWALQQMTAAEQTSQMQGLHAAVWSAIHAEAQGTGWFGEEEGRGAPLDLSVAQREAGDLVVRVGFQAEGGGSLKGEAHLYATVYGGRVAFDPDTPEVPDVSSESGLSSDAESPASSAAPARAPTPTQGPTPTDDLTPAKKTSGKRILKNAVKGLERVYGYEARDE